MGFRGGRNDQMVYGINESSLDFPEVFEMNGSSQDFSEAPRHTPQRAPPNRPAVYHTGYLEMAVEPPRHTPQRAPPNRPAVYHTGYLEMAVEPPRRASSSYPNARAPSNPNVRAPSNPNVRAPSYPNVRAPSNPSARASSSNPNARASSNPSARASSSNPNARASTNPSARASSNPDGSGTSGYKEPSDYSIYKSYGGYMNFLHSYGLRVWNPEDVDEGHQIVAEMKKHMREEAAQASRSNYSRN